MKFENWMVGKKVVDIDTGDMGYISHAYGDDRVYIDWTTGSMTGCQLHLPLSDVKFFDDEGSVWVEKLKKIERLVAEVKEMLGNG